MKGEEYFFWLFVVLAIAVLYLLTPYLGVIAIALVTFVILKPLYNWFRTRKRIKERPRVAMTLTLLTFILLILVPLFIIGVLLLSQTGEPLENIALADV